MARKEAGLERRSSFMVRSTTDSATSPTTAETNFSPTVNSKQLKKLRNDFEKARALDNQRKQRAKKERRETEKKELNGYGTALRDLNQKLRKNSSPEETKQIESQIGQINHRISVLFDSEVRKKLPSSKRVQPKINGTAQRSSATTIRYTANTIIEKLRNTEQAYEAARLVAEQSPTDPQKDYALKTAALKRDIAKAEMEIYTAKADIAHHQREEIVIENAAKLSKFTQVKGFFGQPKKSKELSNSAQQIAKARINEFEERITEANERLAQAEQKAKESKDALNQLMAENKMYIDIGPSIVQN